MELLSDQHNKSMYPNLIEDLNDGVADQDFDLRKINETGSVRSDITATLDQPHTLSIRHETVGSGNGETRRSNVKFDRVVENADGVQGKLTVSLTVTAPTKVTDVATIDKELNLMKSFLATSGYIAKLSAGEI